MNAQLSIFSFLPDVSAAPALYTPAAEEGDTIEDRFARFNKANPQVYSALREMALTLKDQGIRHYGIAALFLVGSFLLRHVVTKILFSILKTTSGQSQSSLFKS